MALDKPSIETTRKSIEMRKLAKKFFNLIIFWRSHRPLWYAGWLNRFFHNAKTDFIVLFPLSHWLYQISSQSLSTYCIFTRHTDCTVPFLLFFRLYCTSINYTEYTVPAWRCSHRLKMILLPVLWGSNLWISTRAVTLQAKETNESS